MSTMLLKEGYVEIIQCSCWSLWPAGNEKGWKSGCWIQYNLNAIQSRFAKSFASKLFAKRFRGFLEFLFIFFLFSSIFYFLLSLFSEGKIIRFSNQGFTCKGLE